MTILSGLSFSQPLRQMSVQTGQPVTLFCQLGQSAEQSDTDRMRVKWFRNDELLTPSRCLRMGVQLHSIDGRLSLTIQRVSRTHAGRYRCEVGCGTGTVSTQCDLEVNGNSDNCTLFHLVYRLITNNLLSITDLLTLVIAIN